MTVTSGSSAHTSEVGMGEGPLGRDRGRRGEGLGMMALRRLRVGKSSQSTVSVATEDGTRSLGLAN